MINIKQNRTWLFGGAVTLIAVIFTILTCYMLYQQTVTLLTENLRNTLKAIVVTGSVQFDSHDLNALQKEEDWKKPEWSKVVNQLKKMRLENDSILFAYIFRKSSADPNKLVFVADSHSLNPYAKVDLNNDGIIDDADQLQWPGQSYDEPPPEALEGFGQPTTNKQVYYDQWGSEISGYAPIKDEKGSTIAVLAVDIKAGDFLTITSQTLYPFIIFIVVLISVLFILAITLIYIWNKRVEFLADLDQQKDELLSIVSHQLAAPVTSIKWYLEMLLDGDQGELQSEQKKTIQSLQSIGGDLSDLVSMILDVSRIQLGKVRLDPQEIDLQVFFTELMEVIEPKAKEKPVNLVKNIPNNLPKAKLDKRYTRMTVENLLTNAIKYTPANGNVVIDVELRGDNLFCKVKDTGCGIPKAEQGKIFGKLFRASNVRNSIEGNGFGLYVAKGAIESQGGKIWFESTEGKGTSFFVELPLK